MLDWATQYTNNLKILITDGKTTRTVHKTWNYQGYEVEQNFDEKGDKACISMTSVVENSSIILALSDLDVYGFSMDGNHGMFQNSSKLDHLSTLLIPFLYPWERSDSAILGTLCNEPSKPEACGSSDKHK